MAKKKHKTILYVKPRSITEISKIRPLHFMQSITTIHGINYFAIEKGRGLILWSIFMIFHILLTIAFFVIIKDRFNSDQIATKIYSDWSVDKVPFPAVSICNFNPVSVNESRTIANILQLRNHNYENEPNEKINQEIIKAVAELIENKITASLKNKIPQQEIEEFFRDLYYLLDFAEFSTDVANHSKIMEILKAHYYNVDIIMEEVHQKCENLLVYCSFNNIEKDCKDLFNKIQTVAGYCCIFNFNGLDEDNDPTKSLDDDFEMYYDQGSDGESSTVTNMIATSQSGGSSGLKVVFNVEPEDYGSWSLAPAYGAKILISDPNDFVETTFMYTYMAIGESVDLKVDPRIYQCEENLRFVDVEKRGCWFHKEVELVNTGRYSYETCNTECKIKSYREYCGCTPYKYPVDKSTRICEFSDLKCLHYMRVHWETTKAQCVPECYNECQDKEYTVVTDSVPFLSEYYPDYVTSRRNISELSALHVYYIQSTCNCYMMTVLMDTNTFIATYGGIFSICFGASVITIFELVYLSLAWCIKTMWKLYVIKLNHIKK